MSREKLRRIIALLHAEAQSPGSHTREVITRLREVAALYEKDCASARPADAGLQRTLEQIHARPHEAWTVAALARIAGMSRAVFARKFVAAFGATPLQYLNAERMEIAAALLVDSDASVAAVAHGIGYESEWAFRRAFKRHHGIAPGRYRRQSAHAQPRMTLALAA